MDARNPPAISSARLRRDFCFKLAALLVRVRFIIMFGKNGTSRGGGGGGEKGSGMVVRKSL